MRVLTQQQMLGEARLLPIKKHDDESCFFYGSKHKIYDRAKPDLLKRVPLPRFQRCRGGNAVEIVAAATDVVAAVVIGFQRAYRYAVAAGSVGKHPVPQVHSHVRDINSRAGVEEHKIAKLKLVPVNRKPNAPLHCGGAWQLVVQRAVHHSGEGRAVNPGAGDTTKQVAGSQPIHQRFHQRLLVGSVVRHQ